MRYAIWTTGVGGMQVAEVESAEAALEWVREHTTIIPVTYRRPRCTISFTTDQDYTAVELDERSPETA